MRAGLQTYTVRDIGGGLDIKQQPLALLRGRYSNRLTVATNVQFLEDGSVGSRFGWTLVNRAATLIGGTHGHIQGGVHYQKSDGTSQVIVATADNLYKLDLTGTTVVTSIKSGLTSSKRYTFAVLNDILFIANGVDAPMQYDGTTVTALGGSSPATMRVVVAHANRLFATATAAPSRLYWSKLNNPTDWSGLTDAGFLDVNPNDGGALVALVPSNQELVLLKEHRPYRLQGIGPTTGYTVADNMTPATGSVGATYITGAVYAGNDVFYVSRVGVHSLAATQQFGDLKESFVSEPIQSYFRTTSGSPYYSLFPTGLSGQNTPQLVSNVGDDCLYVSMRSSSALAAMDTLLTYDRQSRAWAVWKLGDASSPSTPTLEHSAMWPYEDPDNGPTLMMGAVADPAGVSGCYVVKLLADQLQTVQAVQDDTWTTGGTAHQNYTSIIQHATDLGAPNVVKSPRYVYLYFQNFSASDDVDVKIYYDYNTTAAYSGSTGYTSGVTNAVKECRIDLWGVCEFMTVEIRSPISAPRAWRFLGYRVLWRPRREVWQAQAFATHSP